MAASATFALKAGVWFRRGRLLIVSPDSLGTACPLSGRNSTYRPVQISETSSKWPEALIGVPGGRRVGMWFLDVDSREGHGVDGLDAWYKLPPWGETSST